MKNKWCVSRRHYICGELYIQTKNVHTYKEAVEWARKWYLMHGIHYGIVIWYFIPEVGRYIRVKDYYLINRVEEIKG